MKIIRRREKNLAMNKNLKRPAGRKNKINHIRLDTKRNAKKSTQRTAQRRSALCNFGKKSALWFPKTVTKFTARSAKK